MTQVLFAILILGQTVAATDLSRETVSLYRSYQTTAHLQRMQFDNLSRQMDDVWRTSREIDALRKDENYTSKSGRLYNKLGELERSVRETSHVFYQENMKVKMNATAAEDLVSMRRDAYLKRLDNLAAMDRPTLQSLGLPKEIASDIEARKGMKDLNELEKRQLWNQYEGRKFGDKVPLNDDERMAKMIQGIRRSGTVDIDTYHTTRSVPIREGQLLRLQTPTGAIVQGQVMGLLSDGKVLIQDIYSTHLKDSVRGLAGARIIDLSQARQFNLYADKGRLASGQPELELSVRLGHKEIVSAIKSQNISSIARRKPVNGGFEDRARVNATVIDKRGGEVIGNAIREGTGAVLGLGF